MITKEKLNRLGKQGWELVSISANDGTVRLFLTKYYKKYDNVQVFFNILDFITII